VAAGQSSTITGTLAGQIVMEGYLNLRIAPWLRRLITRLIAIIPAYVVILMYGEEKTGELLVFSQVVLSLQLGFAVIPLIHFTSDKLKMGVFAIKPWVKILAWTIALIIVSLNVKLVINEISGWIDGAGENAWMVWFTAVPVCLGAAGLLAYITIKPIIERKAEEKEHNIPPHGTALTIAHVTAPQYQRVAATIDFSSVDALTIQSALAQGSKDAKFLLIHVVETAGAMVYGSDISDAESQRDEIALEDYARQIREQGYDVSIKIGFGDPKNVIPKMVKEFEADLLVMGAHGHRLIKDIIFGTTVDTVRHRVKIPVLITRQSEK
jgi:manganese transport protein